MARRILRPAACSTRTKPPLQTFPGLLPWLVTGMEMALRCRSYDPSRQKKSSDPRGSATFSPPFFPRPARTPARSVLDHFAEGQFAPASQKLSRAPLSAIWTTKPAQQTPAPPRMHRNRSLSCSSPFSTNSATMK